MRGRTFLARDVLRPPRQTHPACASRSGELRLDCRLVHGRADAVSRHRRQPARQFVLHGEFLADAARRRRGLFRGRRDGEAAPASLVAQHRRAILSRLVGSAACAVQARAAAGPPRHRKRVRRFVRVQHLSHADRSDLRLLPALDAGMGTRAGSADRLSRGLLARGAALSVAKDRQHRRRRRDRADARRLPVSQRDAALSRLAGGDSDPWMCAGHRQSGFASGRGGARQSPRRLFRRHLLSALSVALAAVRVRSHLAGRDPDCARSVRARGRGGGACGAHVPADRAADRNSVSPPAVYNCARARGPACR